MMQRYTRTTPHALPEGRAPLRRPGARSVHLDAVSLESDSTHENQRLGAYETRIKNSFDQVIPLVRDLVSKQFDVDFVECASEQIRDLLGCEPPRALLQHAWTGQLDVKALVSHLTLSVYLQFVTEAIQTRPLAHPGCEAFQRFLAECGYHRFDITPCADGRMAHVIRYVLRLPAELVRRKAYAGAVFDIEDNLAKWAEVELTRTTRGDSSSTKYLKVVAYHFSSINGETEGCAAHGSDDQKAIKAGRAALDGFKKAVAQTFHQDAAVEGLLIGVDTATDAIRLHLPDAEGLIPLDTVISAIDCSGMDRPAIQAHVETCAPHAVPGMRQLAARLIEHNLEQLAYVNARHAGVYPDIGHAERFIGIGVGFDEIQLRNLMYFGYLHTVEEGGADIDVGLKIFKGLNQARGLATPIVIRFDYYGSIPGAKTRAAKRAARVAEALRTRYPEQFARAEIHYVQVSRDLETREPPELLGSNLPSLIQEIGQ